MSEDKPIKVMIVDDHKGSSLYLLEKELDLKIRECICTHQYHHNY